MFLTGKQSIKSYFVFTSFRYRITVYALLPLALAAVAVWGGVNIGDIGLMLMAAVLPLAEVVSDSWLFGGIQAKDMEKMDYLKSSGRGMSVPGNALRGDLVRKFCTSFGSIVLSYLIIRLAKGYLPAGSEGQEPGWMDFIGRGGNVRKIGILLYLVLLAYFVSVLGTFLSRFCNTIYWNMLIGYAAMVLEILGLFVPGLSFYQSFFLYVLDLLWAALGIGASVLAVRVAMKKVEGGYYDQ